MLSGPDVPCICPSIREHGEKAHLLQQQPLGSYWALICQKHPLGSRIAGGLEHSPALTRSTGTGWLRCHHRGVKPPVLCPVQNTEASQQASLARLTCKYWLQLQQVSADAELQHLADPCAFPLRQVRKIVHFWCSSECACQSPAPRKHYIRVSTKCTSWASSFRIRYKPQEG